MKRLENKVAIITGGSSGIGKATAELFLEEGASVVIVGASNKGKELEDKWRQKGYSIMFIQADVSIEYQVKDLINRTVGIYGKLDILFANAGVGEDASIDELEFEKWKKTIDINLNGVFLSNKYSIEQMLKQSSGGVIVNCGSVHGYVGAKGMTAYASAKGGVKLLTRTLGATYARKGIRINAVAPGYIETPLLENINKEYLVKLHPMRRLGKPEEVAKAVLFLASEDASFITGTELLVDGGYTAV